MRENTDNSMMSGVGGGARGGGVAVDPSFLPMTGRSNWATAQMEPWADVWVDLEMDGLILETPGHQQEEQGGYGNNQVPQTPTFSPPFSPQHQVLQTPTFSPQHTDGQHQPLPDAQPHGVWGDIFAAAQDDPGEQDIFAAAQDIFAAAQQHEYQEASRGQALHSESRLPSTFREMHGGDSGDIEIESNAPVPEEEASISGTFRDAQLFTPASVDVDAELSSVVDVDTGQPLGDPWQANPWQDPGTEASEMGLLAAQVDGADDRQQFFQSLGAAPGMESGASGSTQATDASGNTMLSNTTASSTSSWRSNLSAAARNARNRARSVGKSASAAARKKISGAKKTLREEIRNDNEVDLDDKMIRRYEFKTEGRSREISLSHAQYTWYLQLDSVLVATKVHSNSVFKNFSTSVDIDIQPLEDMETGARFEPLIATMRMEWLARSVKWKYSLLVGDVDVTPCWSKSTGAVADFVPHDIFFSQILEV
jgi:hypothetical protein